MILSLWLTVSLCAGEAQEERPPLPEGRVVLSHICLRYKGAQGASRGVTRTKEEALKAVEGIRARLAGGPGLWSELVKKHSEDARSVPQDGKIGVFDWRALPVYARDAAAELAALEPGEFSRPIASIAGVHIFRWEGTVPLGFLEIVIGYKGSKISPVFARDPITRGRAEALELAERVVLEARAAGADFDAVATKYTDMLDLEGYARGYVTYRGYTALPRIAEALSKIEIGEVAGPVESPYGYHVLKRVVPEIRARQIVVVFGRAGRSGAVRTEEEARKFAEELLSQIKEGTATFHELAERHSDHEESAARGGDLGRVPLHYFFPPVERAAFALKEGGITGVVRGSGAFKIVQRY
jgi:parvulin-like peptidyl-prolyl isomerase